MEKLGLPMEKTFTNLHKYGNTAGASVPIAMREAMDEGLIGPGSLVVTAAFGGGLAWGANVIQFWFYGFNGYLLYIEQPI